MYIHIHGLYIHINSYLIYIDAYYAYNITYYHIHLGYTSFLASSLPRLLGRMQLSEEVEAHSLACASDRFLRSIDTNDSNTIKEWFARLLVVQ